MRNTKEGKSILKYILIFLGLLALSCGSWFLYKGMVRPKLPVEIIYVDYPELGIRRGFKLKNISIQQLSVQVSIDNLAGAPSDKYKIDLGPNSTSEVVTAAPVGNIITMTQENYPPLKVTIPQK